MQELSDVFENFAMTRMQLDGKAAIIDSPDQKRLLRDIPRLFEKRLAQVGLADLYKVEGSIGNGNMARVPWVAVFRREITESAQDGYYIVLLFAEDMSCCYLSLNQGVTAMERLYTPKLAHKKMREAAVLARQFFDPFAEANIGPLELKSNGALARGYGIAAIESFCYEHESLPTEELFLHHFDLLLAHYEQLVRKFGRELQSIVTIDETEFQQAVLEKAATTEEIYVEPNGPIEVKPIVGFAGKGHVRSPKVAAQAIRNANFECEIDRLHPTFQSRARKQPYVEAHHLVPMSAQPAFLYSLDVVANVVALCATCHRLLHHGLRTEKQPLLRKLLASRRPQLQEKAIEVTDTALFNYYGRDFADDD